MNSNVTIEHCDLCIIGAGVAGLNALAVAREYLGKAARVILVDKRARCGGMWIDTYDYVRLHQPHRMFTAGDIPWRPSKPAEYLARKPEVLQHLEACLNECRQSFHLSEYFGYELVSQAEIKSDGEYRAHLILSSANEQHTNLEINAKRCIKAFGFRVPQNPPLQFSSERVISVSPHDKTLRGDNFSSCEAPCYIVGGGKTAMDTAVEVIQKFPNKAVNLIVGRGTIFLNRDKVFPKGISRWFSGPTTLSAFTDLALRFNGDNAEDVFEHLKNTYTLQLSDDYQHYFFGILSERENEIIRHGVREVIKDYLVDVTDEGDCALIKFRSGKQFSVPRNAWFVNCTGYIARQEHDYEPYISEHGTIVSVQPTSGIHFLSTFGAYFLTHLLFLDKLKHLGLYELDYQTLIRRDRFAFPFVSIAQTMYNVLQIMEAVPTSVMTRCGVDFDNWFPVYRRLLGGLKLKRNHAAYSERFKQTLDVVQKKYDIRCGELAGRVG